jgi:hypothetical protein
MLKIKEKISKKVKQHYQDHPEKLKEMQEREKISAKDPERNKKISIKTKEAMAKPEVREKYLEGLKTRDQSFMENETFKNSRQGGKKNKGRKHEGQALINIQEAAKNKHISEDSKQIMRDNGTKVGKEICARRVICTKCGFEGTPLNIGRYHNEKCKMTDWKSIENEYKDNKISIRKIALKYNIEHHTITKRANKEEWIRC